MSPVFQNDNEHLVSVPVDGKQHKLRAGKAGVFDGDVADAFRELVDDGRGVRELEGDEARDVLDAQRADRANTPVTAESRLGTEAAQARNEVNRLTVAAPLQVVVGDDVAPYGPPSGVKSTKQAEAAKSPEARRQFAANEPLIGDRVDGVDDATALERRTATVPVGAIHNAQETNRRTIEEAVQPSGLVDATALSDDGDDEGDGEADGSIADLRARAKELGVSAAGSKAALRERIAEAEAKQAEAEQAEATPAEAEQQEA